jgi:hypothetical protein
MDRPTCGKGCPHYSPLDLEGEGAPEAECLKDPPMPLAWHEPGSRTEVAGVVLASHRPHVSVDTPCCGAHPGFAAYFAVWQADKGDATPADLLTFTWHALNAGELSVEAADETAARAVAERTLASRVTADGPYTEADLDFDLMKLRTTKPDAGEE